MSTDLESNYNMATVCDGRRRHANALWQNFESFKPIWVLGGRSSIHYAQLGPETQYCTSGCNTSIGRERSVRKLTDLKIWTVLQ